MGKYTFLDRQCRLSHKMYISDVYHCYETIDRSHTYHFKKIKVIKERISSDLYALELTHPPLSAYDTAVYSHSKLTLLVFFTVANASHFTNPTFYLHMD